VAQQGNRTTFRKLIGGQSDQKHLIRAPFLAHAGSVDPA